MITIQILSDDLHDARVTLYMPQQRLFAWFPVSHSALTHGTVTFPVTVDATTRFALVVRDSGDWVARSGPLNHSSGQWEAGTGDFRGDFYFQSLPEPFNLSLDELRRRLPPLPMTIHDGGSPLFRLDRLELSINNSRIFVEGEGEYLRRGAGPLAIRYEFRLRPSRALLQAERLIEVDTVSSEIRSIRTGIGSVTNWAVNLVLRVMRERLAGLLRSAVQQAIDDAVAQLLESLDSGDQMTVTLRALTIRAEEGVLAWPGIFMNMQQVTCPARLASSTAQMQHRGQVDLLRSLRDRRLKGTIRGVRYLEWFEVHRSELMKLLLADAQFRRRLHGSLKRLSEELSLGSEDTGQLSSEAIDEIRALLKHAQDLASPALAERCAELKEELEDFRGRPVKQVLTRKRE